MRNASAAKLGAADVKFDHKIDLPKSRKAGLPRRHLHPLRPQHIYHAPRDPRRMTTPAAPVLD
jgi:hypothetical protein